MDDASLGKFVELLRLVVSQTPGGTVTSAQLQPYMNPHMNIQRIRKGQQIVRMYQTVQDIILVVQGEFYLTRSSASGMSSMVARIWAPEFLGIPQLVSDDKLYYSNITASENCLVVNIEGDYFAECMHRSPEVSIYCVNSMSRALQRNYKQMERIAFFDATENLMAYLYRKWVEAGAKQQLLCVKEKHTIIANELGVTVRTVCRALSRLKEQDMCTTDRAGHIYCTPGQMERIQRAYR